MSDQLCGMWYLSLVDASLRKCRGEEGVEEQVEVEDDVDVEEPALFEGIKVGRGVCERCFCVSCTLFFFLLGPPRP